MGALGEKATQSSSRLFHTGPLPNGVQALCSVLCPTFISSFKEKYRGKGREVNSSVVEMNSSYRPGVLSTEQVREYQTH